MFRFKSGTFQFVLLFIYIQNKQKHMSVKEQYWKYSLITIILGLGLILFIKMSPFMGGIFRSMHHLHYGKKTNVLSYPRKAFQKKALQPFYS